MIHIVSNTSDISLLKEVVKLDENLAGEVIQIREEFGVGPLADLETEEGWLARGTWWRTLLKNSPYQNDPQSFFDDRETVKKIKEHLDDKTDDQVWIWIGQNQHDVCTYYWLVSLFKEYAGRILIIYLNNLPFINEKGQLFYPSWIQEIQPKELLKAKKLARPVTASEFEIDSDEWKKLCTENAIVRILEGGKKIVGKDESFYDSEILKNSTPEWQKASRVLSNTLHRMKIKTGDVFLMWRMKELISQGKIEVLGDAAKGWKEFDIRLPQAVVPIENSPEERLNIQ
ncbi:MAG TPA: DUF1835 domain-containing protein [Chitinophagaceae bacterium]|nr:DUF1835 domain-containing protein [Chitinophagaceae bacterium]